MFGTSSVLYRSYISDKTIIFVQGWENMLEVKEVSSNVFLLEPEIDGIQNAFSIYLIQMNDGKGVIIEPGPTITLPYVLEAMKSLGISDLSYIILTHIHVDHAGGAGAISGLYPKAKVLVHPSGVQHLIDPSRLIRGTKRVWGHDFEEKFGSVMPVPESRIRVPKDSEVISVDGRELQIIYTPGHAPHHFAIYDRSIGGLFCGEAVGWLGQGSEPFPLPAVSPPNFEQKAYVESLELLSRLKPRKLFLSHGGVINEPDAFLTLSMKNTQAFRQIVFEGLKEGVTQDAINKRIVGYALNCHDGKLDETALKMTAGGYTLYFMNKEMA